MTAMLKLTMLLTLIFVSGCTHPPTHQLNACRAACEQQFKVCSQVCSNSCLKCGRRANLVASFNHKRYVHEQCVRGGMIVRQLQSYRDPLKCRKATCECAGDYQVCAQACNGVIQKRLKPALFCC